MHNPESIGKNATHKILWNFEILTDHQFLGGRPNLVLINTTKRTRRFEFFGFPADQGVNMNVTETMDLYFDLNREGKNK